MLFIPLLSLAFSARAYEVVPRDSSSDNATYSTTDLTSLVADYAFESRCQFDFIKRLGYEVKVDTENRFTRNGIYIDDRNLCQFNSLESAKRASLLTIYLPSAGVTREQVVGFAQNLKNKLNNDENTKCAFNLALKPNVKAAAEAISKGATNVGFLGLSSSSERHSFTGSEEAFFNIEYPRPWSSKTELVAGGKEVKCLTVGSGATEAFSVFKSEKVVMDCAMGQRTVNELTMFNFFWSAEVPSGNNR